MELPAAFRRLETDRENVFAFDIVGHIRASDVENIYGLLEGACSLHDKVDMLVRIRDYEGIDWDAAMKDFRLLAKTDTLKHIRRYAVIGGPGWIGAIIAIFKPFFRVELKHFDATEEALAWAWIDAKEVPRKA
jgi:hypothetical protein